jgi:cyclopropane-fatty-acyl-phospholipid synthase
MGRHSWRDDKAAIGFHYDVGNDFYQLWLDSRMIYSCAYFEAPDTGLDDAQRAKLDHICRKLRLAPGERFLDVGCGWGGLAIYAAQEYGVQATGITLSKSQLDYGLERVAALGLGGRVELLPLDYRELPKRFGRAAFDKAASIGMFEHVGLRRLTEYFGAVAHVLRDRGLFLNHGITSADVDHRPVGSGVSEFIERYVFPHGELPHMHLAARELSAAGFEVCDVEGLRPHYAKTLEHWSRRLDANLDAAARLVPARTLRVWRAYLAGSAHGFAQGWVNIYQLLASRQVEPGLTELPLTRAWMYR